MTKKMFRANTHQFHGAGALDDSLRAFLRMPPSGRRARGVGLILFYFFLVPSPLG